jgi:hypothetical protein
VNFKVSDAAHEKPPVQDRLRSSSISLRSASMRSRASCPAS